jgi:Cell division control protein 24, OB domain 3
MLVFRSQGILNCGWLLPGVLSSTPRGDLVRVTASVIGMELATQCDAITIRRHRRCERTLVHFTEAFQQHRCSWCRCAIDPLLDSELVFNLKFRLDNGHVNVLAEALPSVQEVGVSVSTRKR